MSLPLERDSDNPAVVYLEALSPGSYWAVRHSLETVGAIVAGEGIDPWTFPWWELRYRDTARVRAALIGRFAPSTVNRTRSRAGDSPRRVEAHHAPPQGGGSTSTPALAASALKQPMVGLNRAF
jgi:hypothetical protein